MRYTSRDPATGRWLGSVPAQTLAEARAALAGVAALQERWSGVALEERLAVIGRMAAALEAERVVLAEQVCLEVGKPRAEALAEVDKCVLLCRFVMEMAPGVLRQRHLRLDAVDAWVAENPAPAGLELRWGGLSYINVIWQDLMVSGMGRALAGSWVTVLIMMMLLSLSFLIAAIAGGLFGALITKIAPIL